MKRQLPTLALSCRSSHNHSLEDAARVTDSVLPRRDRRNGRPGLLEWLKAAPQPERAAPQGHTRVFIALGCPRRAVRNALTVAALNLLLLAPGLIQAAPDLTATRQLFVKRCSVCHGADAGGSDRGPALTGSRRMRTRSATEIAKIIRNGTPGGMPALTLPEVEVSPLAGYVRLLNASAFDAKPEGNVAEGERFFYAQGRCSGCHSALGRGGLVGPDLSNIGRQLTLVELEQAVTDPQARIAPGYETASVTLNDGTTLRGLARSRGSHDIQLQTLKGEMRLVNDKQYRDLRIETGSLMPVIPVTAEQRRDLVAWLSRLDGAKTGALTQAMDKQSPAEFDALLHPESGDWPSYYGDLSGNRFSKLDQINTRNASKLQPQWIYPIQYQPLETTPLVVDGIMYVTGPNQVFALDGRTGREIWRYVRPRTPAGVIASDAGIGANRGVALLGDRVFFNTDNAHMLCLNRLTGAVMWDVYMPESAQHYGTTSAPLVIGDLVISGVAGGDEGIRGFVGAWKVATGELAWRFWTVPKPGEPASETWKGNTLEAGGGSTWLTGTYDSESGLIYWPTGNPFPDTDGNDRGGTNLYTDCDIALDAKTGKLKWYFQFTPHDLHDWDAVQPPVLIDAKFQGSDRKLLLHANRNGYFYVLDRTNGKFLFGKPFVKKLSWSSGLDASGHPILTANNETTPAGVKTCPAVRGATNWYSPAYSPLTNLYYVMVVEDCSLYRQARQGGFGFLNDPKDPGMKYLRALDLETGAIAWEIAQVGPVERNYSGVLATAGGLVFYGESSGGFAAVDAKSGTTLWHFEAGSPWKGSPMTYTIEGRQYVAIASGANILSFALPVE